MRPAAKHGSWLAKVAPEAPSLRAMPEVDETTAAWWQAFLLFSRSRPIGLAGPGPIPVEAILAGAFLFPFDRRELVEVIVEVDDHYLAELDKRRGERPRP